MTEIVILNLIIIASIAKSIQDKIQFHYHKSVFKKLNNFWNPEYSWKNKYKEGNPDKGPKFPGSTTIFIALTDAWHLFGLIRNFSLILIPTIITENLWFLLLYPIFIIIFHLFFHKILNKNNSK